MTDHLDEERGTIDKRGGLLRRNMQIIMMMLAACKAENSVKPTNSASIQGLQANSALQLTDSSENSNSSPNLQSYRLFVTIPPTMPIMNSEKGNVYFRKLTRDNDGKPKYEVLESKQIPDSVEYVSAILPLSQAIDIYITDGRGYLVAEQTIPPVILNLPIRRKNAAQLPEIYAIPTSAGTTAMSLIVHRLVAPGSPGGDPNCICFDYVTAAKMARTLGMLSAKKNQSPSLIFTADSLLDLEAKAPREQAEAGKIADVIVNAIHSFNSTLKGRAIDEDLEVGIAAGSRRMSGIEINGLPASTHPVDLESEIYLAEHEQLEATTEAYATFLSTARERIASRLPADMQATAMQSAAIGRAMTAVLAAWQLENNRYAIDRLTAIWIQIMFIEQIRQVSDLNVLKTYDFNSVTADNGPLNVIRSFIQQISTLLKSGDKASQETNLTNIVTALFASFNGTTQRQIAISWLDLMDFDEKDANLINDIINAGRNGIPQYIENDNAPSPSRFSVGVEKIHL